MAGDITDIREARANRRGIHPRMTAQQNDALDRLFEIAIHSDSGGAARVANFLMAWWNAGDYGGFDFTDFWNVDDNILRDFFIVLPFIAANRTYLDEDEYFKAKFHQVFAAWRKPKRRRKSKADT